MLTLGHMRGWGTTTATLPLQDQILGLTRAWNGKGFTADQGTAVLQAARVVAQRATTSGWEGVAGVSAAAAANSVRQIDYLIGVLAPALGTAFQFATPHKTWSDVKAATLAPVFWWSATETAVQSARGVTAVGQTLDYITALIGAVGALPLAAAAGGPKAPVVPPGVVPGTAAWDKQPGATDYLPWIVGGAVVVLGVAGAVGWLYAGRRQVAMARSWR